MNYNGIWIFAEYVDYETDRRNVSDFNGHPEKNYRGRKADDTCYAAGIGDKRKIWWNKRLNSGLFFNESR